MEFLRTAGVRALDRILSLHGGRVATAIVTIVAAMASCATAFFAFPVFAGVAATEVLPAVAATATIVAIPIGHWVVLAAVRAQRQTRELAAREELLAAAQKIGRLEYWHFDPREKRFYLPEGLDDLLEPSGRTPGVSLASLQQVTHPEDRETLTTAVDSLIAGGGPISRSASPPVGRKR